MHLFENQAQLFEWVNADVYNGLTYIIECNPRGAYDVIRATFPEFPIWNKGLEQTYDAKVKMFDFVKGKAELSSNPAVTIFNFGLTVPRLPGSEKTFLKSSNA